MGMGMKGGTGILPPQVNFSFIKDLRGEKVQ